MTVSIESSRRVMVWGWSLMSSMKIRNQRITVSFQEGPINGTFTSIIVENSRR